MDELSVQNEMADAKLMSFEAMVKEMRTEMKAMKVWLHCNEICFCSLVDTGYICV